MILDAFLAFDQAVSLAIAAGTQVSTNVLDLHMLGIPVLASGQGARDMGIGDNPALKMLVQVSTTFTSGGSGTLSVALQGAPDNGSGAPGTYTTWWVSPVYALATLIQGARLFDMDMPRPPAGVGIPRFLRLLWTVGTATMTAGNASAYIVIDRHDQPEQANAILGAYPAGIAVAN